MNTLLLIKKMSDLADYDKCGVDDISLEDYSSYVLHRKMCVYCNARETLNNIGEDLVYFNERFKVIEE